MIISEKCLQVSETVPCRKLRCCYSLNVLQDWTGGGTWFISSKWIISEFLYIFPATDLVSIIRVGYCWLCAEKYGNSAIKHMLKLKNRILEKAVNMCSLTSNIFDLFFWSFYCWLWTGKWVFNVPTLSKIFVAKI